MWGDFPEKQNEFRDNYSLKTFGKLQKADDIQTFSYSHKRSEKPSNGVW